LNKVLQCQGVMLHFPIDKLAISFGLEEVLHLTKT
jgi:hypothetical protein